MDVKTTVIKKVDLKKLMKQKGIKDLKQLAKVAGIGYEYLKKCEKNYVIMGDATWKKLKRSL